MGKSKEQVVCEPFDVARWIGLANASLLGVQPFSLMPKTVIKLEQFGDRAELLSGEAAAILRVTPNTVRLYTLDKRGIQLGHRLDTSSRVWIPAADLAAFIEARSKPPIPTTGKAPKVDTVATLRLMAEARRRHNLPPL